VALIQHARPDAHRPAAPIEHIAGPPAIVRGRTVSLLEGASKAATTVSIVLLVIFQIAVNPDPTPTMRAAAAVAMALGFAMGAGSRQIAVAAFILAAPLMPALLWQRTGREGPVLELICMAGLGGALLRTSSWLRWQLPPNWRVLLGGWALTLSLVWPVLMAREAGFSLHTLRDLGAINSWALMPAPQVVSWIAYIVLAQLIGLVWLEWLFTRFIQSPLRLPRAAHALWLGTSIATIVAIYQGVVDIRFLNGALWTAVRRAGATMLDANAYGVAAAFAGPIAALAIGRARGRIKPAIAVVVCGLNLAGMWVSGSRSALLCGVLSTVALLVAAFGQRWLTSDGSARARDGREPMAPPPGRRVWIAVAVLIAIIGSAVVAAMSTQAVGPLRRVANAPTITGALATLWDRYGYGSIAARMVADYPLTGIGAGGFQYLAPDYWRSMTFRQLALDSAQNWWRQELAEFGILGAAPIILWSIVAGWQLLRRRIVREGGLPAATLRAGLVGLALVSFVQVPTQSFYVLLWFFFLVAWLAALTGLTPQDAPSSVRSHRIAWCVAVALAVVHVAGHVVLAAGPLSVAARARAAHREYVTGGYSLEPLEFGAFRWVPEKAHFIVPVRRDKVIMRVWAQHPDIATRPVHVKLSGPCGVVFDASLSSTEPVELEIIMPPGVPVLEFDADVSRTWRPSDYGSTDRRRLGAGIQTDFNYNGRQWQLTHMRPVTLTSCGAQQ
jgi:hypothetical protein